MAGGAVARVLGTGIKDAAEAAWSKIWNPSLERGYIQSGEAGLRHIGPLAETAGQMARQARDNFESRFGKVLAYREPLAHDIIRSGASEEVINDLERKVRATDPKAKALADYDKLLNNALIPEAAQHGIKIGPLNPDDFHHMWDSEMFEGVNKQKIIKHLVTTGQARDESHAQQIIQRQMQTNMGSGMVHTLSSARRVNLPGYRRDLAVMSDHFGAVIKKIEQTKVFGPNDEAYTKLLEGIKQQHGQFAHDYTKNIVDNILGRSAGYTSEIDQGLGKGWYRKIASIEAMGHLGLAVLSHTGQPLNAVLMSARGGLTPLVGAMRDAIFDHGNAMSFLAKSGATFLHASREARRIAGAETETMGGKLLRYTQFSYIDKIRRMFSGLLGKNFAEQQFEKFLANPKDQKVINNLRIFGIDPAEVQKAGGLQERHLIQAAKRMSDITQFRTDAMTVPPKWLDNKEPTLRLAVMYKQYFYQQSKFIKDQVLKPALLEKEFKPLIAMGILFPTFGEIVGDMKEFARKGNLDDRPGFDKNHWLDRMASNYAVVGGIGILADLVNAFAAPDKAAAGRYLIGPAFGDTIDIGQMLFMKHPIPAVEKKIVQSVPVVGPISSRKLFPSKQHQKGPLQRGVITREFNKLFGF